MKTIQLARWIQDALRGPKRVWNLLLRLTWWGISRISGSTTRLKCAKTGSTQAHVNLSKSVHMLMATQSWIERQNMGNKIKIIKLNCARSGTNRPQSHVHTGISASSYMMNMISLTNSKWLSFLMRQVGMRGTNMGIQPPTVATTPLPIPVRLLTQKKPLRHNSLLSLRI